VNYSFNIRHCFNIAHHQKKKNPAPLRSLHKYNIILKTYYV